jgi:hypothetical protein
MKFSTKEQIQKRINRVTHLYFEITKYLKWLNKRLENLRKATKKLIKILFDRYDDTGSSLKCIYFWTFNFCIKIKLNRNFLYSKVPKWISVQNILLFALFWRLSAKIIILYDKNFKLLTIIFSQSSRFL